MLWRVVENAGLVDHRGEIRRVPGREAETGRMVVEVVNSDGPAVTAQAAEAPAGKNNRGSRDILLAMAERLRASPPPQRPSRQPGLAWPSGPMSFDEFLLQWPCEVDLPIDLNDQAFIEEAHQAILLRGPDAAELDQYLRLRQNNVVSKPWIIEDLLASEELHALERRVRVNWGGNVITEPGRPEDAAMPAVTWPWRTAT